MKKDEKDEINNILKKYSYKPNIRNFYFSIFFIPIQIIITILLFQTVNHVSLWLIILISLINICFTIKIQYFIINREKKIKIILDISKLKSEFFRHITHNLRTPLNSIIGFTQILIDGIGDTDECLPLILDSGQNLLKLINELLDINLIETGKIEVQQTSFSIKNTILRCLDLFKGKTATPIKFQNNLSPEYDEFIGDEAKIMLVLFNLVGNSVKFTDFEKSIGIILGKENNYIKIIIWDKGIGIEKENFPLIFKQFGRVKENTENQYPGSGLGLYHSKQIIELLGGKLTVESIFGEGSKFSFTLPITQKNPEPESFLRNMWETEA